MNLKKLVSLALALCLVIPAGIAFAEEEVIIIEEPVAAEEVVEEVVEVEPVEVEPVAEEEIEVVDGYADNTVTWAQIRDKAGHGKEYEVVSVPTCETQGWYEKADGTSGPIAALGHKGAEITLAYDDASGKKSWSISYDADCTDTDTTYYIFTYCAGSVHDTVILSDGITVKTVQSCNHLLDAKGNMVGTAGVHDVSWPIADSAKTTLESLGSSDHATLGTAAAAGTGTEGTEWHAHLIRKYTQHHDWQKVYVPASCKYGAGYYYACARAGCPKILDSTTAASYDTTPPDDFKDNDFGLASANKGKGINIPVKYNATTSSPGDCVRFVQTSTETDSENHYWDTNFRNPINDEWYSNVELEKGDWGTKANTHRWISPAGGEPTCEKAGILHGEVCSACTLPIVRTLPKVDHEMTGEAIVITEPTCTTNGYKAYACRWCGRTDVFGTDAIEIPALGHTFNRAGYIDGTASPDGNPHPIKWIHVETVKHDYLGNATVTDKYVYRAVCDECDYYVDCLSDKTPDTTPSTGFYANYGPGGTNKTYTAKAIIEDENTNIHCDAGNHPAQCITKIPAVPATKDKNGYTEGAYCSVCGEILTYPKYVAPLSAGLVKNKDNGQWEYQVNGKKDTEFVGLVELSNELFFVRNGTVDTSVMGIQQPEEGGTWYFFDHGQVQRNHAGFALYDGAWFYIDATGKLDESATGYYAYDGAQFLVTGGWVRTDYTGMYPESDARTSFRYIVAGMWMEDFTGTVTIEGETWNVTKGVATK